MGASFSLAMVSSRSGSRRISESARHRPRAAASWFSGHQPVAAQRPACVQRVQAVPSMIAFRRPALPSTGSVDAGPHGRRRIGSGRSRTMRSSGTPDRRKRAWASSLHGRFTRTLWQVPPRDDPDRLSEDDGRILDLESASIAGHTLKLMILEPGVGALDIEALQAAVTERLHSSRGRPRGWTPLARSHAGFRRRLSTSVTTSGAGPTRSACRRPTCGGSSAG